MTKANIIQLQLSYLPRYKYNVSAVAVRYLVRKTNLQARCEANTNNLQLRCGDNDNWVTATLHNIIII